MKRWNKYCQVMSLALFGASLYLYFNYVTMDAIYYAVVAVFIKPREKEIKA